MLAAAIEHLAVDLIAQDRDVGMFGEARHQFLDLGFAVGAAGWVGRAVDDDQPRARRDEREQLVGREREAVGLAQRQRNGGGAGEVDRGFVDRETRGWDR